MSRGEKRIFRRGGCDFAYHFVGVDAHIDPCGDSRPHLFAPVGGNKCHCESVRRLVRQSVLLWCGARGCGFQSGAKGTRARQTSREYARPRRCAHRLGLTGVAIFGTVYVSVVRCNGSMWASTPTTSCVLLPQKTAILCRFLLPCGGVRSPRPTSRSPLPFPITGGRTESSAPTTVRRHPYQPPLPAHVPPCPAV